jgi:hypothetical protein
VLVPHSEHGTAPGPVIPASRLAAGGSCDAFVSGKSDPVSAMIATHTSTHSSQMNTLGPAASLRTWSCVLPQNEQRRFRLLKPPSGADLPSLFRPNIRTPQSRQS